MQSSLQSRRARVLVSLLGLFIFSMSTVGQTNIWTAGGPFGGNVQQVVVDPMTTTKVFSITQNKVYKSTDSGAHWAPSNTGITDSANQLAIDPSNSNILYVAASNGVFTSSNGGASWSASGWAINVGFISIDPQSPSTLYAGNGSSVYKSVDSGVHWSALTLPGASLLAVATSSPSTLYAISGGNVFKSTDAGGSWFSLSGLPASKTQALAVDPTNANTVYAGTVYSCTGGCDSGSAYKSTDGGATWFGIGFQFNYNFYTIAVSPSDPNTVYASAYYGSGRSTNGGMSWSGVAGLLSSTSSFGIDPTSANTVYAGTSGAGVFRRSNGSDFALSSNGLIPLNTGQIALARTNPSTLFVTGGGGVFKSTDNGAQWSSMNVGSTPVYSLAVDPSNENNVYAGGNYGPSFGGVYKTVDGGAVWQITSHDPYPNAYALAVAPTAPSTVYSGAGGGGSGVNGFIGRTVDAGAHWPMVSQLPATATNLTVDPTNPNIVYAVVNGGNVYKTGDGLGTWSLLSNGLTSPARSITIDANDSQVLYAGTNGGVFKSNDAGGSWSQTNLNKTTTSLAIAPSNSNVIYAGTLGFGVYRSTNAGLTWSTFNSGLGNLNVNALAIDDSGRYLHASTAGGIFNFESIPILTATHFTVSSPSITIAGNNLGVVVTALDQSNNEVINYNGTIHFTSSDPAAVLPADYTFLVKPNQQAASGSSILIQQDFNPLAVSGIAQRIALTSAMNINSITVQFANTFPKNGYMNMDLVKDDGSGKPSNSPADVIATSSNPNFGGYGGNFTFNFSGVTVPAGNIHLVVRTQNIASNGYSILGLVTSNRSTLNGLDVVTVQNPGTGLWSIAAPTQYMYFSINDPVFGDAGKHSFNAVLKTAGTHSITVNDVSMPNIAGTKTPIVVQPATTPASLLVEGFPSPATSGESKSFTVTVKDAFGNDNIGYTGTIHFMSGDSQASLPVDYSFLRKTEQRGNGNSILIHQDFSSLAVGGIGQRVVIAAPITVNSVTVQFANSFPKNGYIYLDLVKDDGSGKPSNSATDIIATSSNSNNGAYGGSFSFAFPSVSIPAGALHLVVRTQNISSNGYSVLSLITTNSPTLAGLDPVLVQNPSTGVWSTVSPQQFMYFSMLGGEGGSHTFSATLRTPGTQSISATDMGNPGVTGAQGNIQVVSPDWTKIVPVGASPNPRRGHGIVYDSARSRAVLFGGLDAGGNFLNDVWEWDGANRTWTNVTPSSGAMPIPRAFFGMAYDPTRNKIVIYGGNVSSQYSNVGITGDTWEWDGATRTWTAKPVASTLVYVGLWGTKLAYDPNLQRVILFGGQPYWVWPQNSGTYSWNGSDWQLVTTSGPPSRVLAGMTTDTTRSRVVLFGGRFRDQNTTFLLQDTWEWDGQNWTQMAIAGSGPSIRENVAIAFDSDRGVSYLFGGSVSSTLLQDFWQWNGQAWTQLAPAHRPSSRHTAMSFDVSQSELVLFGGQSVSGIVGDTFVYGASQYVPPPQNVTPVGTNVAVQPQDSSTGGAPVNLTFSQVTTAGTTSLMSETAGPNPPQGYRLGSPPLYYEISTSALYSGAVQVCINYNGTSLVTQANLKLWHYNTSLNQWQDITTSLDTTGKVICGQTSSLSPFAVLESDAAPSINVPAAITAEATSAAGAVVDYPAVTAHDDFDSSLSVDCSSASGSTFALGTTTVACSVTDSAGNTAQAIFDITVQDTTAPLISSVPSDITSDATSASGAVINYGNPTAEDVVDGSVTVQCSPASGSTFHIGETVVQCTATDAHHNNASATFKVTINTATPTINWDNPADLTYGDALTAVLSATVTRGAGGSIIPGTLTYTPGLGTVLHAGQNQDLRVDFTPDDNITYASVSKTVKINVQKAQLTFRAEDKTRSYGDANPAFTYAVSGFVNGDTAGIITGSPGLSTSALQSSPVATYNIDVANGTLNSSADYNFDFISGTLTVTKARLVVRADDKLKTYGDPAVAFTPSFVGFVNGEGPSVLAGSLTYNFADTPTTPAGLQSIVPGGLSSNNYQLSFAEGKLTVSKVSLIVTADNKSNVWGTNNPPLTATYTGFVNGETSSMLGGSLSLNTTATTNSVPGSYPITVNGVTSSNYNITFVNGTLTVNPRQLTALGPAKLWVGLKNSDDVGTKFDLLAEVLRNGVVIGSSQLNDVVAGSSGFNNAKLDVINLAFSSSTGFGPGDTLGIRLSVRIAASSSHRNGTARLWFNDSAANSSFSGVIESSNSDYFLRSNAALGTSFGPGPKVTIDVSVDRAVGGNPFKPFGTWTTLF